MTVPKILLYTKRLVISNLTRVLQTHIDALNDKQHMRYSEQRLFTHNRVSQLAYINSASETFIPLNINYNDRSIGTMSITIDPINQIADLGLMILPNYDGRGYGKEAWSTVLDWLLTQNNIKIHKVEAGCITENVAMRCICVHSGMDEEGIRWDHFLLDNKRASLSMYGKIK